MVRSPDGPRRSLAPEVAKAVAATPPRAPRPAPTAAVAGPPAAGPALLGSRTAVRARSTAAGISSRAAPPSGELRVPRLPPLPQALRRPP